jgi:hypothetical protein
MGDSSAYEYVSRVCNDGYVQSAKDQYSTECKYIHVLLLILLKICFMCSTGIGILQLQYFQLHLLSCKKDYQRSSPQA